jgi:hypothetical protein
MAISCWLIGDLGFGETVCFKRKMPHPEARHLIFVGGCRGED